MNASVKVTSASVAASENFMVNKIIRSRRYFYNLKSCTDGSTKMRTFYFK